MSDSEDEHPSSTSVCLRESESSISRGEQRAKTRKKMISTSSEGEEEEEEEEKELKEQQPQHQEEATSSCVGLDELPEEEGDSGAAAAIQDEAAYDNFALTEEGDDDGDSVDTDSSGEVPGAETCAICLGRMRGEVGSPESCEHTFCLICILEWAKTNPSCPQDRKEFNKVLVRMSLGLEVDGEVVIRKQESELMLIPENDNPTYCEVCHECDREERLLLCDGCDLGYHLECLDPPLEQVPVEEWFCPGCASANIPSTVMATQAAQSECSSSRMRPTRKPSSSQRPRLIPRTRATERVRDRIIRKRKEKRKKRRQGRKRKMEDGEGGTRLVGEPKERLKFFGSIKDEIPSEDMDDTFADHLLASESGWDSKKDPVVRKTDAAKVLREAAFTPSTSYAGKASVAVINRVNIQSEEARKDDVLSGILEKQTIVLSLTSDRKPKKDGETSEAESFSLKQEEKSLMSDPLPSRRPPQRDREGTAASQDDDRRHSSPPRGNPYSRFSRYSSYSQNPSYGHTSRFEPNHRMQREDRGYREERMQRDERVSGTVQQSPLEDRRRSSPRMSYQRPMPSHQFRNQRNPPFDHRNRDSHTRWDDRQRYQGHPPWKDPGHKQNQFSDTRWGCRHTESSGSNSSREISNQERHGRNGRDSSRENSDHRPSSDRRGSSPASYGNDRYSHRKEDDDKWSRREEDRHRKEERGHHRHYQPREHSHHRGFKASYHTEKGSPSSHSHHHSRSYSRSPGRSKSPIRSRSPVRSKSPIRSRSPVRSRSRSRLRESHSRGHDDSKRRRKDHKHSNNDGESASRVSLSPLPPEGRLEDSNQEQRDHRVTSGHDSCSDLKLSPHLSQHYKPSAKLSSHTPVTTIEKDKHIENKSRSIRKEAFQDKSSAFSERSPTVPREVKRENEGVIDTYCNTDVVDQRILPEVNLRKADTRIDKEGKGNDLGVENKDDLLNDAKSINFRVQSSCKRDQKRDKFHNDIDFEDSSKNDSECDTKSPLSVDYAKDTDKEHEKSEDESLLKAQKQAERKNRKKYLSGFFGRVLEYTPEVELSQWDENSSADVSSPFMVIKKTDATESDRGGISLPFSLEKFLPGERNIFRETNDRKKTPKERKRKHKSDPDNNTCDEETYSDIDKNRSHETHKLEKIDTDNIKKEEGSMSVDKAHKKKSSHTAPKVDTKPHDNKPKESEFSSSSHSSIPRSKSKERYTDKTIIKDSQLYQKESSNSEQEATQSTSQTCNLPNIKSHEHSHKKEHPENMKGCQGMFGDISDISGTDSDSEERCKKVSKGSPVVVKSPDKKKDTQDIKHKIKDTGRKSDHDKKMLKSDELSTKTMKVDDTVASSSQREDTKSKNKGKGTKNVKPKKGHVLDLFGNTSDSDDAKNIEVKVEETKLQKSSEKLSKSSPSKADSVRRKAREHTDKDRDRKAEKITSPHSKASDEAPKSSSESLKEDSTPKKGDHTDIHKGKDRKSEKITSPHKKTSDETPKSSSESLKEDSTPKKGDHTDTHKGKDRKSEKITSPHKKTSDEAPKSSSESVKFGSSHRKAREATDSHKRKDRKSEKETSHKKSSEEVPKSSSESLKDDSVSRKRKAATDTHKGKDKKSDKEKEMSSHKRSSEEAVKSTSSDSPKSESVHRKGKETTDTHKRKDRKSGKETSLHRKSPETDSDLGKTKVDTNNHEERKDRYLQAEHKKVSEKLLQRESPKNNSDIDRIREPTNNDEEQKDGCSHETDNKELQKPSETEPLKTDSDIDRVTEPTTNHEGQITTSQETQRKVLEKPSKAEPPRIDLYIDSVTDTTTNNEGQKNGCSEIKKEVLQNSSEAASSEQHHNQTKEPTDTSTGEPHKHKRLTQTPSEDQGRRKGGCPSDGEGDSQNSKKRKSSSSNEGKRTKDKDPVNRTENKAPVPAASSSSSSFLQSTSHTSDKREKKDTGETFNKQVKASLEQKVVTEVKRWLDPHYRDKNITKEEYKEIVAKCVSKVVSAECGDVIESEKMHILVEGYVKLYRHRRAKQQPPPSS